MSTQMRPFALGPRDGQDVRTLAGQMVFKVRGSQSDGAVLVVETVVEPDEGPPLHVHESEDEWIYVVRGDLRIRLGDDVVAAPAGSFAFIPRGVAHAWQNPGREPATLLAGISPAGMERFFERFGELPDAERTPESFAELGKQHGMTVLGPPLAISHPLRAATSG